MVAKPKRVQVKKGRKQPARQSRGPSRRKTAMVEQEQARSTREGNGHEELAQAERVEQPQEAMAQFARMAGEQVRQAVRQTGWAGAAPQVLGWTGRAPAKPMVSMPISFATRMARMMLADLPLVEVPSSMSPARPSICNCCENTIAKS